MKSVRKGMDTAKKRTQILEIDINTRMRLNKAATDDERKLNKN